MGIEYNIPMEKTIIDMAYSMIETGVLPDKRKKWWRRLKFTLNVFE